MILGFTMVTKVSHKPIVFILIVTLIFSLFSPTHYVSAQHVSRGTSSGIYISHHDIEITQLDDNRIQVSDNKLFFNANNESFSGNINVWVQENSEITMFGPVINSSYKGGKFSLLTSTIYQYNLSDNGHVIPANNSLLIYLKFTTDPAPDDLIFEKTFYYSNLFLEVTVYPTKGREIESSGIHLDYDEKDNYYFSHDSSNRGLGDKITIKILPEKESEDRSVYLVSFTIIIIVVFIIRKNRSKLEKNRAMTDSTGNLSLELIDMDKGARSIITESSKHETPRMKKIKLDSLLEKKKHLLFAMKLLEEENDSGLVSSYEYEKLKEDYRRKTVEVLKGIDDYK